MSLIITFPDGVNVALIVHKFHVSIDTKSAGIQAISVFNHKLLRLGYMPIICHTAQKYYAKIMTRLESFQKFGYY